MRLQEIATAAGVSERQIDYWARAGVFDALARPGSGRPRFFSDDDLAVARIVAAAGRASMALRGEDHGVTLEMAGRLSTFYRVRRPERIFIDTAGALTSDPSQSGPVVVAIHVAAVLAGAEVPA